MPCLHIPVSFHSPVTGHAHAFSFLCFLWYSRTHTLSVRSPVYVYTHAHTAHDAHVAISPGTANHAVSINSEVMQRDVLSVHHVLTSSAVFICCWRPAVTRSHGIKDVSKAVLLFSAKLRSLCHSTKPSAWLYLSSEEHQVMWPCADCYIMVCVNTKCAEARTEGPHGSPPPGVATRNLNQTGRLSATRGLASKVLCGVWDTDCHGWAIQEGTCVKVCAVGMRGPVRHVTERRRSEHFGCHVLQQVAPEDKLCRSCSLMTPSSVSGNAVTSPGTCLPTHEVCAPPGRNEVITNCM
jgi:hypothetical protein